MGSLIIRLPVSAGRFIRLPVSAGLFIRLPAFAGLVLAAFTASGEEAPPPDLVLFNGNVITMETNRPKAEALAIRGERITFVGTSQEVLEMAGPETRRIGLEGKTLIPGFNDDHTHTLAAGSYYHDPVLWGRSCDEIVQIVAEAAARVKPGDLITGNAWDYPTCPHPHRSMLDSAAPHNPVFLSQYSGHGAWVNSSMLEELGIDRDTPDPEGGQIVRDEAGEPTGILRDAAMGGKQLRNYGRQLFQPRKHRESVRRALELYREAGITSVQDNTWEPLTAGILARYGRRGKLSCRFSIWPYGESSLLKRLMWIVNYNESWVRKGCWKYFADGAFSTRTAWLEEPYADEPDNYGAPPHSPEELKEIVLEAARKRRQITFHAIGDRAAHEILNAIEEAQARYPWTKTLRLRLEHLQLISDEDILRMKALGVVACVQPFALASPDKDELILGPGRAKRAYPYYSIFKAGVPLAFGSDIPAEVDYAPLLAIYYAVTRQSKDGTLGPLNPDQRFTPEEALYCYTMGSAYAEFMEEEKGSIRPGKLADVVLLSEDLETVAPERIKDIQVLLTIVGGRVVYRKDGFEQNTM